MRKYKLTVHGRGAHNVGKLHNTIKAVDIKSVKKKLKGTKFVIDKIKLVREYD